MRRSSSAPPRRGAALPLADDDEGDEGEPDARRRPITIGAEQPEASPNAWRGYVSAAARIWGTTMAVMPLLVLTTPWVRDAASPWAVSYIMLKLTPRIRELRGQTVVDRFVAPDHILQPEKFHITVLKLWVPNDAESFFRLGLAWASVRDGLQSIATDAFEIFEFRCGPWHAGHFAVPDAWVAVLMPMQALLITKMTVAVPRLEVGLCTHWHATRA